MSISLNGDGIVSGVTTLTNPSEITVGTGASVFSPASNTLALGTNGSERVRIDSLGNFGTNIQSIPSYNANLHTVSFNGTNGVVHDYAVSGTRTGSIVTQATGVEVGTHTSSPLIFTTNSSERARILAAGGLTFNGDTAAANALNDYEEGTWTPTINGSPTYTGTRTGDYTKIGNIVHVSFIVQITNNSGVAAVSIGGLPYQIDGNTRPIGPVQTDNMSWTGAGSITLYGTNTGTSMGIIRSSDAGAEDYLYIQDDTAFLIRGSLTYTTNS